MAFTKVDAALLTSGQNVLEGDVETFAFSRVTRLKGASSTLLSSAPALTLVSNILTVAAPVRNNDLATFAGLGLTVNTSVAAGNFPAVAIRDVQVKNVASTGHTYTYPVARKIGQLLIVVVATAALTTITTPSGWTASATQAGTESRTTVFKRVLDGLEPSTELLAFGTASGAVIRSWCFDIADGTVEVVSGINDSAAGTSLDLATVTPTWAVAEACNNFYIAVLGTADDVTVSGFPSGYFASGQDKSVSATANIDCNLAWAETQSLSQSENPSAFTYAASRATAHIIAIQPKVSGRIDWDGLGVRKNSGATVGTRRLLNVIEGANVTLTVADNAGTGAVDVTIAAAAGSAHVIRDDGVNMTNRAALNFTSSTTINAVLTDDAGGGETEVALQVIGFTGGDVTSSTNSLVLTIANNAVTNAKAAQMAALTVKANATNALANAQDVAASADDTVFRRTATTLNWGQLTVGMAPNDVWTYAKIQNVSATSRFLGRITAAAGDIEELTGTQATTLLDTFTSALKGLVPASGGGTTNFLRADGTFAVPPDTNTGHLIRDDSVGMTQRAALNFTSTTTINAVLTDDSVNGETEVALQVIGFTGGDVTSSTNSLVLTIANNAVSNAKAADMPANSIKVNPTGSAADPQDLSLSTNNFLGRLGANVAALTGTQATTILDVFTSVLKGLVPASGGGTANFLRADGTFAVPPGTSGPLVYQTVTEAGAGPFTDYVLPDLTTKDATLVVSGVGTRVFNGFISGSGSNVDGMRFKIQASTTPSMIEIVHLAAVGALTNRVATPREDTFRVQARELVEFEFRAGNWRVFSRGLVGASVQRFTTTGTSNDVALDPDTDTLEVDAGNLDWLISGFTGGWAGRRLTVRNSSNSSSRGGFASSGSLAANTIVLPNLEATRTGRRYSAVLEYDGVDSFWRIVSETGFLSQDQEIVNSTATGPLGTIDISTLQCGGTYRVSAASSSYNISGWTSTPVKSQGFWFNFVSEDVADIVTLKHEDTGITATDRMLLPSEADVINKELRGQLVYQGSRWSWLGGNPRHIGSTSAAYVEITAGSSVQVSVPTNQITLTAGAGTPHELIVNPPGSLTGATLNAFPIGFAPTVRLTSFTTTSASVSIVTPLTYTIPANLSAGTSFQYYICVAVTRGATVTASNLVIEWRTGGVARFSQTIGISVSASFNGYIEMTGMFTYLGSPGASTPCGFSGTGVAQIANTSSAVIGQAPSITLVHATNATVVLDCRVNMSVAVAGLSFTPVAGWIKRVS